MTLFQDWIRDRPLPSIGSNAGSAPVAFQGWHHFKEAFAPEVVFQAINSNEGSVRSVLDPFGGSGTTALASQFLGVSSTSIEVNPFLADVIRAKLTHYDSDELAASLGRIKRQVSREPDRSPEHFGRLPPTFIQNSESDRWIFGRSVAGRIGAIFSAVANLPDENHRRLFRVLLGGVLVDTSNCVVNGKGRRYRRNWRDRSVTPLTVESLFDERCRLAFTDIHRYSSRPNVRATVTLGDARSARVRHTHDLAIFSPPYPNSFDYTDVYNIELWMLGYLEDMASNRDLRHRTLSSHVQIKRVYGDAPTTSPTLAGTLDELNSVRDSLWSPWIPDMVGAYFADLSRVLSRVHRSLHSGSSCWIVIGDSRYGGTFVPAARILTELAPNLGWDVISSDGFRSMRSSSQHGGAPELAESLLVLKRN